MTDEIAWGLVETIQNAGRMTQLLYIFIRSRLWMVNCELRDGGVTAIAKGIAGNRVLTVTYCILTHLVLESFG